MTEGTNKVISICHYKRRFRTKSIRTSRQNGIRYRKRTNCWCSSRNCCSSTRREVNDNGKPGVNYIWGDQENQSEGFGTLGFALLAAIILVYLVMVGLYDSFAHPFVVLFAIPLPLLSFISLGLDK
jgi:hypothetical protein